MDTFVMDIKHDDGCKVVRRTVVCKAKNKDVAVSLAVEKLCTSYDDVIHLISIREIRDDEVIAID